eukprot:gnl/TRDRNA2_/TRDRNA2_171646_c1_seq5.p1 gnl/TRDRNA2_/TRDRNA2_171646_c1~~gnl/TRDRNA2_/TRDRNA2_171646_c1_seq5.p1  ORF type:complete len:137 (+),score=8.59 gnl/TRDRNA2_/TRDRNA2_171646_c1_seq5:355-765(+)
MIYRRKCSCHIGKILLAEVDSTLLRCLRHRCKQLHIALVRRRKCPDRIGQALGIALTDSPLRRPGQRCKQQTVWSVHATTRHSICYICKLSYTKMSCLGFPHCVLGQGLRVLVQPASMDSPLLCQLANAGHRPIEL